jgi:hypothetical protein
VKWLSWALGLVFGTLSVVMLVKHGFEVGIGASLALVLAFYEQTMRVLLGWAETPIEALLAALRRQLGLALDLQPHWKHVVVLFWLYFGAYARTRAQAVATADNGARVYAVEIGLIALAGVMISFAVGIGVGTLPLGDAGSSTLAVSLAAAGVIAFELVKATTLATGHKLGFGYPWWDVFRGFAMGSVLPSAVAVGAVFLLLGGVGTVDPPIEFPMLPALSAFVVLIALHDLWSARAHADETLRSEAAIREVAGEPPFRRADRFAFWQREFVQAGRMGLLMLSTIAGAAVFLLTNAGLKLAGM